MRGKTYRKDIQALRGVAVLAVVLFHANESYFPNGYLGVDIFFVISGFVVMPLIFRIFIKQTARERLANLGYFYKNRFYRLAPALAVTLTISAISIFLLGPIDDHQRFSRQGITTLLFIGNLGAYKYSTDYFSPIPNPLIHTWSLSVEEQIYIFLPLIFIMTLRYRRSFVKGAKVVLVAITALSLISSQFPIILQHLYSRIGILSPSHFSFYSPIDRIWQFTLGGLGYLLLERNQGSSKQSAKRTYLLSALIFVILFGSLDIDLKVGSILTSFLALITILSRSFQRLPNFLIQKLEWLGDRSYSIYLVHMPLLYLGQHSPIFQIGSNESRNIQSAIAVVTSLLLGSISYSKIENRYRDRGKFKTIGHQTILGALILTFILPLAIYILMDLGVKHQYWGLDRNVKQPTVAWELDSKCNRMSELHKPCSYKLSKSKDSVLLIGDSHAGHISQALVDAAKKEDWNAFVWAQSGCYVVFQSSAMSRVSDQCLSQNQEILKWVVRNKPTAIVVSEFVYAHSSQKELRNALVTLHSIVPRILLVENNPIFPDVNDYMIARPLVMSPYKPPKSFGISEMIMKDRNASRRLANWASAKGISTMNFNSLFCDLWSCTRFSDKRWLYYDDDHFSVAGAELTIPMLSAYLRKY